MLVFDLSRPETFTSVLKVAGSILDNSPSTDRMGAQWKREIDGKVTLPNGKPLPVVLLANKVTHCGSSPSIGIIFKPVQCDLPDTRVDKEQLDAFCKEHGFIAWFETSAKTNHNIEEAVRGLVADILSHPGGCLRCL
jgi:hypothetical protein